MISNLNNAGRYGSGYETQSAQAAQSAAFQQLVKQTPPLPEVQEQIVQLEKVISRIGRSTEALIERITPISRKNASDGCEQINPVAALCEHAHNLRDMVDRLSRYAQQLDDAYNSVQL